MDCKTTGLCIEHEVDGDQCRHRLLFSGMAGDWATTTEPCFLDLGELSFIGISDCHKGHEGVFRLLGAKVVEDV